MDVLVITQILLYQHSTSENFLSQVRIHGRVFVVFGLEESFDLFLISSNPKNYYEIIMYWLLAIRPA